MFEDVEVGDIVLIPVTEVVPSCGTAKTFLVQCPVDEVCEHDFSVQGEKYRKGTGFRVGSTSLEQALKVEGNAALDQTLEYNTFIEEVINTRQLINEAVQRAKQLIEAIEVAEPEQAARLAKQFLAAIG